MKYILNFLLSILLCFSIGFCNGQSGVKYQGVVTNNENEILPLQTINIKLQLVEESNSSIIVWDENHNTSTDDCGLFEVALGEGNYIDGLPSFDLIDWSNKKYLLNVFLDINLNNNYELLGSNEINASIYALNCRKGVESRSEQQELIFDDNLGVLNLSGNNNTVDINLSQTLKVSDDGAIISILDSEDQILSEVDINSVPFGRNGSNFDFPEGKNGEYIFLKNEEYTVPAGKNLYLLNADAEIEIQMDGIFIEHFTTPNMPVLKSGQIIKNCKCTAVLVEETNFIEPVIIDFSSISQFTVPEGKVLVIKSGLDNDDAIEIRIDGTDCKFLKPNETRGTIIITIPGQSTFSLLYDQFENIISGYLVSLD